LILSILAIDSKAFLDNLGDLLGDLLDFFEPLEDFLEPVDDFLDEDLGVRGVVGVNFSYKDSSNLCNFLAAALAFSFIKLAALSALAAALAALFATAA
jgi:hypothetical protein